MTVAAMREKAHELINKADDAEVEGLLAKLENEQFLEWYEDEEFLAELDEQQRRIEEGLDPTFTLEEVKVNMEKLKAERNKVHGAL